MSTSAELRARLQITGQGMSGAVALYSTMLNDAIMKLAEQEAGIEGLKKDNERLCAMVADLQEQLAKVTAASLEAQAQLVKVASAASSPAATE